MSEELLLAPPVEEAAAAPASVAILIQLIVLAVAFVIGRWLEKIKFQWMGEAGAALLLGLVVGLILRAAGVGARLASAVAFKGGIFFYLLLPVIMFDAGYSLDTRMFVKNVGSVCMYAFAGTTISCFVVGLMMWAFGSWGWCYKMPLLANLTFGALISATDPVTVLAVFQRLNAQPDLYINVFGESVLNDAVGMVLFNVLSAFLGGKDVNAGSVFAGIGLFVGIFLGSAAIGIAIGLLAAFIFRSRYFYSGPVVVNPDTGLEASQTQSGGSSTFEVGLAVVFAYGSYLVADAVHCSGIVAVVVNGMVMNMYVRPNLSAEAEHKIETLFKTLAGLFELFVFSYIGTTMFLVDEEFNILSYLVLCLVALAVSRVANILPCSYLVNLLRPRERHIPPKSQFMMWWAGLRGAMAFALSVEASEKYGEYGRVMKTCTFYIIFITVIINGGTSAFFLQRLKLRAEDTPALLLNYKDSLAGMHGFGSSDAAPDGEEDDGDGAVNGKARAGSRADSKRLDGKGGDSGDEGDRFPNAFGQDDDEESASHRQSFSAAAAAAKASFSKGGSRSIPRPAALLERMRSLNDGRLVDRFDAFDRKVSKMLIHPDARRGTEMTAAAAAASPHGQAPSHAPSSHGYSHIGGHGSHENPDTLGAAAESSSQGVAGADGIAGGAGGAGGSGAGGAGGAGARRPGPQGNGEEGGSGGRRDSPLGGAPASKVTVGPASSLGTVNLKGLTSHPPSSAGAPGSGYASGA